MKYTRYTRHCIFNKDVLLLELDDYVISLIAENVNVDDIPEFREFYHLNGQLFDGVWIGSQRIDETNIHEWVGVRVLRVRNVDFYTEKTHDHIDVPNNLPIKCMVRKRISGNS